jgi:hypothetical protein
MICIRCGHDSKYKERTGRVCPGCKGRFAFEPREGDKMTDAGFQACIHYVSAHGQVRWGVENLYYEVCRRENRRSSPEGPRNLGIISAVLAVIFVAVGFASRQGAFALGAGGAALFAALMLGVAVIMTRRRYVAVPRERFTDMWQRWNRTYGSPEGLIVRPDPDQAPRQPEQAPRWARNAPPRPAEPDIGD